MSKDLNNEILSLNQTRRVLTLGIETSCDDTSLCLLARDRHRLSEKPLILSFVNFSGIELFKEWGGVVPEIAARNHVMKLTPLLNQCLEETIRYFKNSPYSAHLPLSQRELCQQINQVAVTTHPGLSGALMAGVTCAKTLSLLYKIPTIGINHLHAHLEAIHLTQQVPYPYLGLLASGGHSAYYWVSGPDNFELLGTTLDDAAGEAFDKAAKTLGQGYPGGVFIDHWAKKTLASLMKNPSDCANYNFKEKELLKELSHIFPISFKNNDSLHLSFSGVKTSLLNFLQKNPSLKESAKKIADSKTITPEQENEFSRFLASYQMAIVSALVQKFRQAANFVTQTKGHKTFPLVVGGGVACNSWLRHQLQMMSHQLSLPLYIVDPAYCTDNGAMIANLGQLLLGLEKNFPSSLQLGIESTKNRHDLR